MSCQVWHSLKTSNVGFHGVLEVEGLYATGQASRVLQATIRRTEIHQYRYILLYSTYFSSQFI